MPQRNLTDYLTQLLRDQSNLAFMKTLHQVNWTHAERLLESEIDKVRSQLLDTITTENCGRLELPDPVGELVTIQKKVFFPKKDFPDFNFTGRILGPRGATIKRLEKEIGPGCTLAIRGKGSDPKNEINRPNKEEQHVLVTIKETPNRLQLVLDFALKKIQPFLVPVDEEKDELKKSQMVELALLKGSYRDPNASKNMSDQFLTEQLLSQLGQLSLLSNSMYVSQTPLLTPPPSPAAAPSASTGRLPGYPFVSFANGAR